MHSVMTPFGPSLPAVGWVSAPRYAMRRARVLDAMEGLPKGDILEIGCGAGALLSEFAARGFSVTGVELPAEARRIARGLEALFPLMKYFPGRQTFDLGIRLLRLLRRTALVKGWIASRRAPDV